MSPIPFPLGLYETSQMSRTTVCVSVTVIVDVVVTSTVVVVVTVVSVVNVTTEVLVVSGVEVVVDVTVNVRVGMSLAPETQGQAALSSARVYFFRNGGIAGGVESSRVIARLTSALGVIVCVKDVVITVEVSVSVSVKNDVVVNVS